MKPVWRSKTFWFGAVWLVVGVAGVFGFADYAPSENVVEILAVLNGLAVILLRYVTKQPIA